MFQRALACVAVVCSIALFPGAESWASELRLAHQFTESDARHRAARVLAAEMKKRLPDVVISLHPNSSLVPDPTKQYEALLEGKIELSIYPMSYAAAKIPELGIVTMPGVPTNAEIAAVLRGSEFEEKLQALCEEKGFRILTWWWFDGGIASRSRAVTGPESIKGLPARSGGGEAFHKVFVAAGASIAAVPAPEIRASVESGKLDAVQNSFEALVSFGVHEVSKFATLGGYSTLTILVPVIISNTAWQSLSAGERQALEEAAAASDIYFEATQRDAEEMAVAAFTKMGAKVQKLSFEDYAAWLQIAKGTAWKSYRAVSPRADELFDVMLKSFINSGKR